MAHSHQAIDQEFKSQSDRAKATAAAFLKEVDVPLPIRFKQYLQADEKSEHQAFSSLIMLTKQYATKNKLLGKRKNFTDRQIPATPPRSEKTEGIIQKLIALIEKHHNNNKNNVSHQRQLVAMSIAYYFDVGVKQDIPKSRQFAEMATQLGNADAHYLLGYAYENIDHNYRNARIHYENALNGGNTCAHTALSIIYSAGIGDTTKNSSYAHQLIENGIAAENCEALTRSAVFFTRQHVIPYLEKATSKGYTRALEYLGGKYEDGSANEYTDENGNKKTRKDLATAAFFYRLSFLYATSGLLSLHSLTFKLKENYDPFLAYQIAMAYQDGSLLEKTFNLDPVIVFNLFQEDTEFENTPRAIQAYQLITKLSPALRIQMAIYFCSQQNEKGLKFIDAIPLQHFSANESLEVASYIYPTQGIAAAYPFLMHSVSLGSEEAGRMLSNIQRANSGLHGLEIKSPAFTDIEMKTNTIEDYSKLKILRDLFFKQACKNKYSPEEAENISRDLQTLVHQYL